MCGALAAESLMANHFFVLIRKDSTPIRQKTPEGQTQAHPLIGGVPSVNKGKNPLSDLAAMYSR